jgi:rSAM/selenodomain-associated transferase 2
MRVSVVIPVINEAPRISQAIDRAWQAGADEVIVVDGGSDDPTAEIASHSRCQLVNSVAGRATQQNCGAAAATGEVLLFLHADNWLAADGAEQIRQTLANSQHLCGAFRQSIQARGRIYRWLEWGNARRAGRRGLPYGDQGIFIRRNLFEHMGGFPEVPLMEDLIFMRRLRRRAWPVLLPGPLHVDPRRWQRHGVIRQTLRNRCLVTAYHLGVPPSRLAHFYHRHDTP